MKSHRRGFLTPSCTGFVTGCCEELKRSWGIGVTLLKNAEVDLLQKFLGGKLGEGHLWTSIFDVSL